MLKKVTAKIDHGESLARAEALWLLTEADLLTVGRLADDIRRRLVEQVTASVRWEDSIRYLLGQGLTRFIELGPGTALSGFMKRIDKNAQMLNVADAASLEATVKALTTPA